MSKQRKGPRPTHEELVTQLEKNLARECKYSAIGTYMVYYDARGKAIGELDVYGVNLDERRLDIYEVKSGSGHKERAKEQLRRAKHFFKPHFDFIGIYTYLQGNLKEER